MASRHMVCRLFVDDEWKRRVREQLRNEDVFRDGLRREKLWLLVDERDSTPGRFLGRMDDDFFFVDENLAFVGLANPAQDVHQGRLSGSIDADKPNDFARPGLERYVVKRTDAGKRLADRRHPQLWCVASHFGLPSEIGGHPSRSP